MPNPDQAERLQHLQRFYTLLDRLNEKTGGPRRLADSSGKTAWPKRGIYFFMEQGEHRTDSGSGPRLVRVGTHALHYRSGTKLWTRLSQHRGEVSVGGGNHRGSIFRLIVGSALLRKTARNLPSWGVGSNAPAQVRAGEVALEAEVSGIIGAMPFLWLAIEDKPGPESERGYIERNAIALLSNYGKPACDPPSAEWLGHHSDRERVRASGLWNSNHVTEAYEPSFLDALERLIDDWKNP